MLQGGLDRGEEWDVKGVSGEGEGGFMPQVGITQDYVLFSLLPPHIIHGVPKLLPDIQLTFFLVCMEVEDVP